MELEAQIQDLLKRAKIRREAALQEADRLAALIAGLELTTEATNGKSVPRIAQAPPKPKRYVNRRYTAKRGEMRLSILRAMADHDGRDISASQLASYLQRHKPESLARKHISKTSWHKRVSAELGRMTRDGLVETIKRDGKRPWFYSVRTVKE